MTFSIHCYDSRLSLRVLISSKRPRRLLSLFIKLSSRSQRQSLPSTNDVNKARFLISRKYFPPYIFTQ